MLPRPLSSPQFLPSLLLPFSSLVPKYLIPTFPPKFPNLHRCPTLSASSLVHRRSGSSLVRRCSGCSLVLSRLLNSFPLCFSHFRSLSPVPSVYCGRGDRKTAKGNRFNHSFGNVIFFFNLRLILLQLARNVS
ncbi:hypothetical protein QN277_016207 [Acacia crassicarpa]|uniref:Uncharacterized protein n=1 Tax=Acacia crassicarpa TaxID=499986 RepID=A0AAE1MW66_9FABA|nr:hypothetical protein QN277_016207 [Acacia crassicarpa]